MDISTLSPDAIKALAEQALRQREQSRQRGGRYRQSQQEKGLTRLTMYVPASLRDECKNVVESFLQSRGHTLPDDVFNGVSENARGSEGERVSAGVAESVPTGVGGGNRPAMNAKKPRNRRSPRRPTPSVSASGS